MRNVLFCLIIGILFFGCSEENSSTIFANSSNDESSSSIIVESSSSEEFGSSSSFDMFSSSTEISSSSWPQYSYGELIDYRDRHVYKTIKIGEQTWMAENLNFDYHNRMASVLALTLPSLCYNNSRDSCAKYGRLYSWSTAMDSAAVYSKSGQNCGIWSNNKDGLCKKNLYNYTRGACPENWHIPTDSDINNIVHYANTSTEKSDWVKHYWLYGGKDHSQYGLLSQYGYFWSSLEADSGKSVVLNATNSKIDFINELKQNTHFIRCVKDTLPLFHIEHGTMTDERDGQVYTTVKIGTQWWMAENLNYAYTVPIKNLEYSLDSASFCYNNDPDYCFKYGRLYVWKAAMDCENNNNCKNYNDDLKSRGICPEKWHIPSVNEWKTLFDIANNFAIDLKSTKEWLDDGNGSNVFGFNVLPAGFIDNTGHETYHYSSTVHEIWYPNESAGKYTCFGTRVPFSYSFCVGTKCGDFEGNNAVCFSSKERDVIYPEEMENYFALSVRCVKDSTESE